MASIKYSPAFMREVELWVRSRALLDMRNVGPAKRFQRPELYRCGGLQQMHMLYDERMKMAKRYLRQGRSVAWVARKLKYTYQCAFSRAFRDFYGIRPLAWQKELGVVRKRSGTLDGRAKLSKEVDDGRR